MQSTRAHRGEPSIGAMAYARLACWVCVAALALLAGAPAVAQATPRSQTILVLSPDGHVTRQKAVGQTAATATPPPAQGRVAAGARTARKHGHKHKRKRTVVRELRRLRKAGELTGADYRERRDAYRDAKRTARGLEGTRRIELEAVVSNLDGIAARRQLTASRVGPLWLTLQRNVEWWTDGPLPASGQRVGFEGHQLVWQYYPSQGMQIQWLGTFGKLNALAKSKSKRKDRLVDALTDEALGLATERAGGLAWESWFQFGGGSPPWVSSLSQGTGLQALARSAKRLDRQADVFPITQRALKIFTTRPPEGVRVGPEKGWDGPHYLQYSYAPGLYIINGFVQSVVGLHDYAEITGDPTAQRLYEEGEREAAREVPHYDTGAWSLYSRGTSEHESDLSYHELLIDFLDSMCDRTDAEVFCGTAERFVEYESEPPELKLRSRRLRGGKDGTLRLRLSKISSVSVTVQDRKSVV